MRNYLIKGINTDEVQSGAFKQTLPLAEIDQYAWDGSYRPKAHATLAWSKEGLYLSLQAREPKSHMRIEEKEGSDFVYQDSCLEFFLMPFPEEDDRYINFEMNPLGVLLAGIGGEKESRTDLVPEVMKQIQITPCSEEIDSEEVNWSLDVVIPFSVLLHYFPDKTFEQGLKMRGNFYKCGDATLEPHFGAWNLIEFPTPNFHQPSYFGELVLG
jgi:hypothetical protein